ncbi:SGNH hydrolase [Gordonia spumicola]|uniref:SGNH hydrolase n=1 Tax=Gordonia spumicola TaxID=589161 RepID=A0A7I9VDE9_9ACTN|nr:SGNH/GDSL hydrolase family protein [Gordonia spumicola]GEE03324.1 SGNH hydrolase [Gordonia spumicola]
MTFLRYTALGDSFTEGVGDIDETLPNGVRGWADRVAGALHVVDPRVRYANLAIRGRKLVPIVEEQVDAAIALEPDLVTIHAGGNDLLRPSVDIDAIAAVYDDAVRRLVATGATVVVFTPHDPGAAPVFRALRGRFAILAEAMRAIADRRGAVLVDYWRIRDYDDVRLWSFDRLHMSPAGHQRMAIAVLDALGVEHDLQPLPLQPLPELSSVDRHREDLGWVTGFLGPWLGRRLRGVSSGDAVEPRFPTWSVPPA